MCTVPEPKTVKNRIHWDVLGAVEPLRERGAKLLRARDDEISWNVMPTPRATSSASASDTGPAVIELVGTS